MWAGRVADVATLAAAAASQQQQQPQEPTDWRQAFAASAKYQAQSRPADVFAQFTASAGTGLSLAAVGTVAEPKPSPIISQPHQGAGWSRNDTIRSNP